MRKALPFILLLFCCFIGQSQNNETEKADVLIEILPIPDKYSEYLKKADRLFSEKNFEEAKKVYQEASAIKPAEQYPKDMIAKCDAEIKNKQQLNEKEYQEFMKVAEMYMKKPDYDKAIEAYFEALKRKPDDPAAKEGVDTAMYLKNRKN